MGDQVDFDSMSDAELQIKFAEHGLPAMPLTFSTRKLLIDKLKEVRIRNNVPEAIKLGNNLQNAWKSVSALPDNPVDTPRKTSILGAIKSCMPLMDQDFIEALVNDHISKNLTEQKLMPEVDPDIAKLNDALWDLVLEYIVDIPTESKQKKSLNVVKVIVQECFNNWNETHDTKEYVFQLFFKEFASKLHKKGTFCGHRYFPRVNHVYEYLLESFEAKFGVSGMYSYYWDWKLLLMARTVVDGRYVRNKEVLIRFGLELGIFVKQLKEKNIYYNSFLGKNLDKISKITEILKKIYIKEPISAAERHVKILVAYGLTRHETPETLVLALGIMPQDFKTCEGVETELREVIKTIKKQNNNELTALFNDKFTYTDLKIQNILL